MNEKPLITRWKEPRGKKLVNFKLKIPVIDKPDVQQAARQKALHSETNDCVVIYDDGYDDDVQCLGHYETPEINSIRIGDCNKSTNDKITSKQNASITCSAVQYPVSKDVSISKYVSTISPSRNHLNCIVQDNQTVTNSKSLKDSSSVSVLNNIRVSTLMPSPTPPSPDVIVEPNLKRNVRYVDIPIPKQFVQTSTSKKISKPLTPAAVRINSNSYVETSMSNKSNKSLTSTAVRNHSNLLADNKIEVVKQKDRSQKMENIRVIPTHDVSDILYMDTNTSVVNSLENNNCISKLKQIKSKNALQNANSIRPNHVKLKPIVSMKDNTQKDYVNTAGQLSVNVVKEPKSAGVVHSTNQGTQTLIHSWFFKNDKLYSLDQCVDSSKVNAKPKSRLNPIVLHSITQQPTNVEVTAISVNRSEISTNRTSETPQGRLDSSNAFTENTYLTLGLPVPAHCPSMIAKVQRTVGNQCDLLNDTPPTVPQDLRPRDMLPASLTPLDACIYPHKVPPNPASTLPPPYAKLFTKICDDIKSALKFDEDHNIPLHQAVIECDLAKVKTQCIVLQGIKSHLNHRNVYGESALMLAVKLAVHLGEAGRSEVVQLLLKEGADQTVADPEEYTPIHYAVKHGSVNLVRFLLAAERAERVKNKFCRDGLAPLHFAAIGGHNTIIELLAAEQADINIKDLKSGRTPYFFAIERGNIHCAGTLLNLSAKVNEPNFAGHCPPIKTSKINQEDREENNDIEPVELNKHPENPASIKRILNYDNEIVTNKIERRKVIAIDHTTLAIEDETQVEDNSRGHVVYVDQREIQSNMSKVEVVQQDNMADHFCGSTKEVDNLNPSSGSLPMPQIDHQPIDYNVTTDYTTIIPKSTEVVQQDNMADHFCGSTKEVDNLNPSSGSLPMTQIDHQPIDHNVTTDYTTIIPKSTEVVQQDNMADHLCGSIKEVDNLNPSSVSLPMTQIDHQPIDHNVTTDYTTIIPKSTEVVQQDNMADHFCGSTKEVDNLNPSSGSLPMTQIDHQPIDHNVTTDYTTIIPKSTEVVQQDNMADHFCGSIKEVDNLNPSSGSLPMTQIDHQPIDHNVTTDYTTIIPKSTEIVQQDNMADHFCGSTKEVDNLNPSSGSLPMAQIDNQTIDKNVPTDYTTIIPKSTEVVQQDNMADHFCGSTKEVDNLNPNSGSLPMAQIDNQTIDKSVPTDYTTIIPKSTEVVQQDNMADHFCGSTKEVDNLNPSSGSLPMAQIDSQTIDKNVPTDYTTNVPKTTDVVQQDNMTSNFCGNLKEVDDHNPINGGLPLSHIDIQIIGDQKSDSFKEQELDSVFLNVSEELERNLEIEKHISRIKNAEKINEKLSLDQTDVHTMKQGSGSTFQIANGELDDSEENITLSEIRSTILESKKRISEEQKTSDECQCAGKRLLSKRDNNAEDLLQINQSSKTPKLCESKSDLENYNANKEKSSLAEICITKQGSDSTFQILNGELDESEEEDIILSEIRNTILESKKRISEEQKTSDECQCAGKRLLSKRDNNTEDLLQINQSSKTPKLCESKSDLKNYNANKEKSSLAETCITKQGSDSTFLNVNRKLESSVGKTEIISGTNNSRKRSSTRKISEKQITSEGSQYGGKRLLSKRDNNAEDLLQINQSSKTPKLCASKSDLENYNANKEKSSLAETCITKQGSDSICLNVNRKLDTSVEKTKITSGTNNSRKRSSTRKISEKQITSEGSQYGGKRLLSKRDNNAEDLLQINQKSKTPKLCESKSDLENYNANKEKSSLAETCITKQGSDSTFLNVNRKLDSSVGKTEIISETNNSRKRSSTRKIPEKQITSEESQYGGKRLLSKRDNNAEDLLQINQKSKTPKLCDSEIDLENNNANKEKSSLAETYITKQGSDSICLNVNRKLDTSVEKTKITSGTNNSRKRSSTRKIPEKQITSEESQYGGKRLLSKRDNNGEILPLSNQRNSNTEDLIQINQHTKTPIFCESKSKLENQLRTRLREILEKQITSEESQSGGKILQIENQNRDRLCSPQSGHNIKKRGSGSILPKINRTPNQSVESTENNPGMKSTPSKRCARIIVEKQKSSDESQCRVGNNSLKNNTSNCKASGKSNQRARQSNMSKEITDSNPIPSSRKRSRSQVNCDEKLDNTRKSKRPKKQKSLDKDYLYS